MALLNRVGTNVPRFVPHILLLKGLPQFCRKITKNVDLEVDVLDDFTTQLIKQKIVKWDLKKSKSETLCKNYSKLETDLRESQEIKHLTCNQIGGLFQNALDSDDKIQVKQLMKSCIKLDKCPPVATLMNILSACSQTGEKDLILQIKDLCEKHYPDTLKLNANFQHFVAEATWVKGDVSKALELFEEVYRKDAFIRRRIRLMFKSLVPDLVKNKSEAVLLSFVFFSERLVKDFSDFYPLTCVWEVCLLSEWFTDQCIAIELLEKNEGLRKSVISRIPYVVFVLLKCHRTEVVYRLLQVLLKYDMKPQYTNLLTTLLDYHFRCGDYHYCSEIFRWANENDVEFPKDQHIILINVLLNEKMKTPLVSFKANLKEKQKWNLKF